MEKQRAIQVIRNRRHGGKVLEVMVERKNEASGQWAGRTSQNMVLNFTAPAGVEPGLGSYVNTRVTATFPIVWRASWCLNFEASGWCTVRKLARVKLGLKE